jgi:hypothetical protein
MVICIIILFLYVRKRLETLVTFQENEKAAIKLRLFLWRLFADEHNVEGTSCSQVINRLNMKVQIGAAVNMMAPLDTVCLVLQGIF